MVVLVLVYSCTTFSLPTMKVLNKSRVSYVWFDITKRISTENSVDVLLLSHLMGKNNSTISYQDEWEYKLYI